MDPALMILLPDGTANVASSVADKNNNYHIRDAVLHMRPRAGDASLSQWEKESLSRKEVVTETNHRYEQLVESPGR